MMKPKAHQPATQKQTPPSRQNLLPHPETTEEQTSLRWDGKTCVCEGSCPRCSAVQAQSLVSSVHDPSEQEADRIAEKITQKNSAGADAPAVAPAAPAVAVKAKPEAGAVAETALEEELEEELPENGKVLLPDDQALFEEKLGQDLSHVRIHTGEQAEKLARGFNARAFTFKSHIVFNQGEYAPQHAAGQKLLAHELVHVVQQQGGRDDAAAPVSSQPAQIARTPSEDLDERIERISDLLSYGVFDWVITDAEATEALDLLRGMNNEDRTAALQQIDVDRLRSNIPDQFRLELAVMLIAGQSSGRVLEQIRQLLSYDVFDWAITDAEAEHVFNLLTALAPTARDQMLDAMGRLFRRRLYENLPNEAMQTQFMQWWDEHEQRAMQQQAEALRPPEPAPQPEETPIQRKHREFREFWTFMVRRAQEEETESTPSLLDQQREERGPLPSSRAMEIEARYRYDLWVEQEQNNPEYLTISPADLYGRIYGEILQGSIAQVHEDEERRERIEREGRHSLDKWNEFQDFIRNRLNYIQTANPTEARVQEMLLREFIQWVSDHQNSREFQTADPMVIYERIAQRLITPEMDRERMRAESAPQSDEARTAKLDEFLALANQLRSFRDQFPRLVQVPSQGRDIIIYGSPAIQYALDAMANELGQWALAHYNDGDFTTQSSRSVLLTIVRANEREYQAAQLMPWLTESVMRTDLDPDTVIGSFFTSLGQVLLISAILGIVVGAELLTAGQVTWIMLAVAGGFGVDAFLTRREEIEQTNVDVPVAETVLHSAGDLIGLSQVIEGATGFRLGTEQQLNSVQRSELLGGGAGQITGIFLGSRAYRAGLGRGAAWRQSVMRATTGPPPTASLLPGPPEHFPFAGSGARMPVPERPNCVYRIMNLAEAAEALRTNRLPESATGTNSQKYFTLDSRYAMLFRERNLAQAERLGGRIESMEANLAELDTRIAQVRTEGNASRLAELEASRVQLVDRISQESARVRQQAQTLIDEWFYNPDQSVVVEIELQPGALDHILGRAVHQRYISQYQGQNVYIWLVERGYGRNIAVPDWQLGHFNRNLIRSIRLHSTRAPFGRQGISTDPGHSVAPSGSN